MIWFSFDRFSAFKPAIESQTEYFQFLKFKTELEMN